MAQAVDVVNVAIPIYDAQSNPIATQWQIFFSQMAPLCLGGVGYISGQLQANDANFVYQGLSRVLTFFLLQSNAAAALAAYNLFVATLPQGVITQVWYSTQTLGS